MSTTLKLTLKLSRYKYKITQKPYMDSGTNLGDVPSLDHKSDNSKN